MTITDELLLRAIEGKSPDEILGENGLLSQLRKRLIEAALQGEMTDHLGYDKHAKGKEGNNSRNGYYAKTIKSADGETEIKVPRDRNGEFEPQIIPKGKTRLAGLDKTVISLYSAGLTTRDIKQHIQEIYGVDISPTLISKVTDEVMDDVRAWRNQPVESHYAFVYFDAMCFKIKEKGRIRSKAVYLCLGVNMSGRKSILGMWIQEKEGASFWLQIFNELKNRGLEDILIATVDGLKGFPEAIKASFPNTRVQLCIVHKVRSSLKTVSYKDRQKVVTALREIYTAPTAEEGLQRLEDFGGKFNERHRIIYDRWLHDWEHLATFYDFSPKIRKTIYTNNPIESMNRDLRKSTKNRPILPSDEAAYKLLYLTIQNVQKRWDTMKIYGWNQTLNELYIHFPNRIPEAVGRY